MRRRLSNPSAHRPDPFRDARLAQLAVAFLLAATLLACVELLVHGDLTTPVLGLGVIGGALLPFGVITSLIAPRGLGDDEGTSDDDDHGGGGGGGGDSEPVRPTGGLEFDWDRFEQDFRSYAAAAMPAGELLQV